MDGDVGADVMLLDRLGGCEAGGTADVGLPGKVAPPDPVAAEEVGPPVKSSSPSFSPERSP